MGRRSFSAFLGGVVGTIVLLGILSKALYMPRCYDHNLYAVLEVGQDASNSELRKAWHQQSLKYHPDKQRGISWFSRWLLHKQLWRRGINGVEEAFMQVSSAYDILADSDDRRDHDVRLHACLTDDSQNIAARGLARRAYLESRPGLLLTPRDICAICAESLDRVALRLPISAAVMRPLARGVDSIALYLEHQEQRVSLATLPWFILFILFIGVAVVPALLSFISFFISLPLKYVKRKLGLSARERALKTEGLRRARQRQAEGISKKPVASRSAGKPTKRHFPRSISMHVDSASAERPPLVYF